MRPGHRGQRSASTSEALRSVVRARHCTCGHAGWRRGRLLEFEFGWYCVLHSGVGLLLFNCFFMDRGRGGEVMGDGLAGADQTLTTSPTSLTRCRGLLLLPPFPR